MHADSATITNRAGSPFVKCVLDGGLFPLSDWDFSAPGSSDDNTEWVGIRRTRVGRHVQEKGTSVSFP